MGRDARVKSTYATTWVTCWQAHTHIHTRMCPHSTNLRTWPFVHKIDHTGF